MIFLKKIWKKFKQAPDLWFFYGFLLTFTLSIRKIIFFYPIKNIFNEYTSISIYLSDIFLLLTLSSWLFSVLYNKYSILSIKTTLKPRLSTEKLWISCWNWFKCSTPARQCQFLAGGCNIFRDKLILISSLLIAWSFLSIFWSSNQTIAFFRSIKLLEFFLLFAFIKFRLFSINIKEKNKTSVLKTIILFLIFIGLFQSIIAIWQFIFQHSLGLSWLKESFISPETLGVAKIIIGQEKYIRVYGLFPHPNILGGFLFISIIFTHIFIKLFHVEQFNENIFLRERIGKLSISLKKLFHCHNSKLYLNKWFKQLNLKWLLLGIFLGIQTIALFLTFSKSAIIGLIIALIYIFIHQEKNVPRGTIEKKKMFHVEQLKQLRYYFLLSFVIFGILLFYFKVDLYALFVQSLEERFIYLTASIQSITQNMLFGIGNGQFVFEMGNYLTQNLAFWQYQPVHNVFLLIFSELGMIGLFFFVWFILELFHACPPVPVFGRRVEHFKPKYYHTKFISASQDNKILKQFQNNGKKNCSTPAPLNVPRGTFSSGWNIYLKAIILGFVFIMIFDHYLWDIQQGSLILWIMLGLLLAKK